MPIVILPLTAARVDEAVRAEWAGFESHPRMPMMFPRGVNEDLYAFGADGCHKAFADPDSYSFIAVDVAPGADPVTAPVVGRSAWTFALDAEKNAQAAPPDPDEPPPAFWPRDGNWAMRRFFKKNLFDLTKESFDGKPYIMLDSLSIHPSFQGRGIGAQLIAWGLQEADSRGVPVALESTPAGLPLYRKKGFVIERDILCDMAQFGIEEEYSPDKLKRIWMIRQPRPL